jgi:NADH-quinone oxidoreductase subunit L
VTVLETGLFNVAWFMIAVPLVVAALLLVLGRRSDAWGHVLATVAPIVAFVIGLVLFIDLLGRGGASRAVDVGVYRFIDVGAWDLRVGLLIDQLSILFVLLITFVGSLIHIYAIGYMAHDTDRRRFFAYLNLFIAAMLTLVFTWWYVLTRSMPTRVQPRWQWRSSAPLPCCSAPGSVRRRRTSRRSSPDRR